MLMEGLMNREERERKQDKIKDESSKIEEYRKKIADDIYIEHAIRKIATDLSKYLTK